MTLLRAADGLGPLQTLLQTSARVQALQRVESAANASYAESGAVKIVLGATTPSIVERPGALQRGKVKVAADKMGNIRTVTVKKTRKTTGYTGGQGSHNTSYETFIDMIKLRLWNVTLTQAAQQLMDLYNELGTFPGDAINNDNYRYAKFVALCDVTTAQTNPTKDTLAAAADALLDMRAKMPLTRTDDGKKTVGKEYFHTYLVQMEKAARVKGKDAKDHKYYGSRYMFIWEMFDYQPTTSVPNGTIYDAVYQHLMSMQATYEQLFADGDLAFTDAATYFVTNNWKSFTSRMRKRTRDYPATNVKKKNVKDLLLAI